MKKDSNKQNMIIDPVIIFKYVVLVAYIYHHNKRLVLLIIAMVRMFFTKQFRNDLLRFYQEVQRNPSTFVFEDVVNTIETIMSGYINRYHRPIEVY